MKIGRNTEWTENIILQFTNYKLLQEISKQLKKNLRKQNVENSQNNIGKNPQAPIMVCRPFHT